MSLFDHARAARILADAFDSKARQHSFDKAAPILRALSDSYHDAARRMEAEARADIAAIGGGCTLDHSRLKGPTKCVCGASAANR
jgi:hypothetical protein